MTLEEEILKLDLIASDAFEGGDANEFRQLAEWLRALKTLTQNLERQIKGAEEELKYEYTKKPLDLNKIQIIRIYKECLKGVLYNEMDDIDNAYKADREVNADGDCN